MNKQLDDFEGLMVRSGLERCQELLDSRILWDRQWPIYHHSVLIDVLINLTDLLMVANKHGYRISFTDDIVPDTKLKILDITDLVKNFRDAACHNNTFRNKAEDGILSFNWIIGEGVITMVGDRVIGSKYRDELTLNVGENIIYMHRHIERAFYEVKPFIRILLNEPL